MNRFFRLNTELLSRGTNLLILLLAVVSMVLPIIGSSLIQTDWGINQSQYLPTFLYYIWLVLCVVGLALLFVAPTRHPIAELLSKYLWGEKMIMGRILFLAAGLLIFFIFRFDGFFYGDGYLRISNFAQKTNPIFRWHELGGTMVPYIFYIMLKALGIGNVMAALWGYRIVTFISALIFLFFTIKISEIISEKSSERAVFLLLILFSGISLYFFGLVEFTPAVMALAVAFFFFLIKLVKQNDRRYLLYLWLIFLSGLFFSILFLAHLPVMVYLTFRYLIRRLKVGSFFGSLAGFIVVLCGVIIVYLKAVGNPALSDGILFLSGKSPEVGYWLFSPAHLADILNLSFLFVPLCLIMIFAALYSFRQLKADSISRLFGLLIISQTIFLFILDPKDGMARDMDMFGILLIGFIFAGVYALIRLMSLPSFSTDLIMHLCPIAIILILPVFYVHLSAETSIRYLDDYLEKNEMKYESALYAFRDYYVVEGEFEKATQREKTINAKAPGALESQIVTDLYAHGRVDEAFEYALRLVERFPYNPTYRVQKGNLLKHYKRYDDAESEFKTALALDKYRPQTYHYLSELYRQTRRNHDCFGAIEKGLTIDPEDVLLLVDLMGYYFRSGRLNSMDSTAGIVRSLDSDEPYTYMYLGLAAEKRKKFQQALEYFEIFLQSPTEHPEKPLIQSRKDAIIAVTRDSTAAE